MKKTSNRVKSAMVMATAFAIGMGILPSVAYASAGPGWTPDEIATPDASSEQQFSPGNVALIAKNVVQGCLGIAIGVFVLKIILTAVDRMILAGGAADSFRLDDVPLVGAYRDPNRNGGGGGKDNETWTWTRIWTHFAMQVGLCVSAWVITELLMGLISAVATTGGF